MPVLKNARHERFARELFKGETADKAYVLAGFKENRGNAIRLKANERIMSRVAELQAAVAEKAAVDEAWVLQRLTEEADADLADLYENGRLKPIDQWPLVWRKGLVAGLDIEEIKVGDVSVGSIKKLRISDRIKRVELIGKHAAVQAFRERLEVTGANGGPIETADVSARSVIAERLAGLASRSEEEKPAVETRH